MNIRKRSWALSAFLISATPFIATEAIAAGGLDGSNNMVCAVIDVVACVDDQACTQGTARSFDLPQFMIFDSEKKVLRATDESGHNAVSPIKNIERSGEQLILQGVENSRGWNIAIDTKAGSMSGSVVGDAVSMLVFGNCTSL